MALRTKNAIRRSFIELLAERPFDKISVRDIAERSEVTRNTFYYYYTDIYALAEDVFESEIEKLSERVEGYESWQKAFLTATSFAAENKRMILHLHNSAHSDILARYYHKTILTTMLSYIRKEAEGTDTYEKNQNLLLSDGARADSVPNLEIETGVIEGAGHASATGRFDETQLFYLMARGIPQDEGRRLVVRAFFAVIIDRIGVPSVTEHLMEAIDAELAVSLGAASKAANEEEQV